MIDKFDLEKEIPEEVELLSYVYSLAEELGLLTTVYFDDDNVPHYIPTKENIYQFKSRYNNNELNGSFKYEGYIKNKDIQDTLSALELDSEKFWLLLLFIFDYSWGVCLEGVKWEEDPKEQIDKLCDAIAENIKEFNQFSNRPVFHNEAELTFSVKGKRKVIINNPIALLYLLKKCSPDGDLEKLWVQKSPNGIMTLDVISKDEPNITSESVHIWFFAKTFFSFFKANPQIKGRQKKGDTISCSKNLLISRLAYFTKLTTNKDYDGDEEHLKGIVKQYKNHQLKATNNIYWYQFTSITILLIQFLLSKLKGVKNWIFFIPFYLHQNPPSLQCHKTKTIRSGAHQFKNCKNIMYLYFLSENRTIGTKRVNESYARLKEFGFIKEIGMIEYVIGNCLEGKKILSARIVKKDDGKPLSLKNWKLVMEEVPYSSDKKVCVDGQGRYVASMLMKMIDDDTTIDEDSIYKEVTVPEGMDVIELILSKNCGTPWSYADVQNTSISSGNEIIDTLDLLAKQSNINYQSVYDFATINKGNLTCNQVKKMKEGTGKLPSNINLNDQSIEMASTLLGIISEHPILTKDRISTRFSKGLKLFCKNNDITNYNDVYDVINAITKPLWEQHFTPESGTSAEAKMYADGFLKIYESIKLQEPAQVLQPTTV